MSDMIKNLDPLDVLELIDFHPESIKREGNKIQCFCPISQNTDERYMEIDIGTCEFLSNPPDLPEQRGTMIELYARVRRLDLDEAVEELAEEFGILLISDDSVDSEVLEEEAKVFLDKAAQDGGDRAESLQEAEKRYARILSKDANNIGALKGIWQVRLIEGNAFNLGQATLKLNEVLRQKKDHESIVEVSTKHLEVIPEDQPIRRQLADALIGLGRKEDAYIQLVALAESTEKAGFLDEALKAYREARKYGPVGKVQAALINLLLAKGRKTEAIKEIDLEIERLKRDDKFGRASKAASLKLKINPNDDNTRVQVIELAILAGLDDEVVSRCLRVIGGMVKGERYEKAAEALSYLSAERPDDARILEQLVECYKRSEQGELAHEMSYRLADLFSESGSLEKASSIYSEKLNENGEDFRAIIGMARLNALRGHRPEALSRLRQLVEMSLVNMNDEQALAAVQEICKIDPEQWEDRSEEIEMLWALGQRDKSRALCLVLAGELETKKEFSRLEKVLKGHLKRDPDVPEVVNALAGAYEGQGEVDKARALRQEVLEKFSKAGDVAKLETTLRDFIASKPDDVKLRERLVSIYGQQRREADWREAMIDLARVCEGLGQKERNCNLMGEVANTFPGDVALQEEVLAVCIESKHQKGIVQLTLRLVEHHSTASKMKEALELTRTALLEVAGNPELLKSQLDIYHTLGRKDEVVQTGLKLVETYRANGDGQAEADALNKVFANGYENLDLLERLVLLLSQQHPEGVELVTRLEDFLIHRGSDIERAIRVLEEVAKHAPSRREPWLKLIQLYKTAGQEDKMAVALAAAVEALEAAHEQNETLVDLYTELLKVRSDNFIARSRLVELLRGTNQPQEAIRQHLILAEQYRDGGRLNEAASAFEKMYEFSPGNEEILIGHATLLHEMGRADAATRKMRQLASFLAEQGRSERAVELLHDAISKDSENGDLRQVLIELLRNAQRFQEASEELHIQAEICFVAGEDKAGITALREAIAMTPDAIELRQILADKLIGAGRKDEAQAEKLSLAEILSNQGQPHKALAVTEEVLKETPSSIVARRLRAQIYDSIGDEKSALAEYRAMQGYLESSSGNALPGGGKEEDDPGFFPGLQIMPEYNFSNFVVGGKNNFAYATSKAVAARPGTVHNPLFLYSDVGLGKTHLLQAIANELKKKDPEIRILYASTEYFTSALIEAIQNNTVTSFRNRYRKSDLLLLDDVQFLAGKERSQEEFFHIFNILHQDGRQIVVTSDRPPKDIAHLDMRIRSRFGQGVIVDIQPPDLETRMAILQAEAKKRKITVSEEAISVLAECVNTNVRELKGAFNQLLTQHEICGDEINAVTAHAIVEKFFGN